MILQDKLIRERLHELVSLDYCVNCTMDGIESQINPNSLDLTLDSITLYPCQGKIVDYGRENAPCCRGFIHNDGYILMPGESILCQSREYITMPYDLCGQVFTKSTLGRLFVNHMMAGVIDAGFHGNITFELKNEGTYGVKFHQGDRICQIVFMELVDEAEKAYGERETSRYQDQQAPTSAQKEKK